jgi:hypothetical protein
MPARTILRKGTRKYSNASKNNTKEGDNEKMVKGKEKEEMP